MSNHYAVHLKVIQNNVECQHKHTHTMDYYSAIEKNEILSFVTTWMNLQHIVLSKKVREKQMPMISLICGI